jgi:hypothetical protein
MPDCEYCGRTFDDEEAHLDHLAEVHADELGAIDRRRVEKRGGEDADGLDWTLPALLAAGVVILGVAAVVLFPGLLPGGGGDGGIETEPLPERGDTALLTGVQSYDGLSRQHVSGDTGVDYAQMPPVGGPHYDRTVSPRFYEEQQSLEALVHNLEHGHVVIHYDPASVTPAARESLWAFARAHTDHWAAVVVVPTPVEEPRSPYVLTAWGHRMAMDDYDAETVRAFVAEYVGRGPERPVR